MQLQSLKNYFHLNVISMGSKKLPDISSEEKTPLRSKKIVMIVRQKEDKVKYRCNRLQIMESSF